MHKKSKMRKVLKKRFVSYFKVFFPATAMIVFNEDDKTNVEECLPQPIPRNSET